MSFIGELITLQCTKCGVKHQSVRGSNVVFKLDANGKITEHGNYLYVMTCECKLPEHAVVISFDNQKNESIPLWRDMSGTLHDPSTMTNDYVFNVFLMIWNHSVPTHMRAHLPPYTRYTKFPKCYTKAYLKEMFHVMHEQLKNRGNFGTTPLQIGLIAYVEKWLSSGQCDFMKKKDK